MFLSSSGVMITNFVQENESLFGKVFENNFFNLFSMKIVWTCI